MGTGMAWVIGFIVLSSGLAILIMIAAMLFASQGGHLKDKKFVSEVFLEKQLILLMDEPLENGETFGELVEDAGNGENEKEKMDVFKTAARSFIDENMPVGQYGYNRVWIRLYKPDSKVGQYFTDHPYGDYSAYKSHLGGAGGIECDPSEDILLLKFFVNNEKMIVICGDYA